MKKLIKDICIELLIMYIAAVIVKILMNKFTFDLNYFIEVIPFVIGISIGAITFEYFNSRRKDKYLRK